jgi:hypothetical protein
MKRWTPICVALALTACATQEQTDGRDVAQGIRDYIEVRQLAEQDKIRTGSSDSWHELDGRYIIYTTRRETFLVEFVRNCYELNETPVIADVRRDASTIRARFDTIRGCLIGRMFALTENDVAELEAISESPTNATNAP